jgi:hypothetical protein
MASVREGAAAPPPTQPPLFWAHQHAGQLGQPFLWHVHPAGQRPRGGASRGSQGVGTALAGHNLCSRAGQAGFELGRRLLAEGEHHGCGSAGGCDQGPQGRDDVSEWRRRDVSPVCACVSTNTHNTTETWARRRADIRSAGLTTTRLNRTHGGDGAFSVPSQRRQQPAASTSPGAGTGQICACGGWTQPARRPPPARPGAAQRRCERAQHSSQTSRGRPPQQRWCGPCPSWCPAPASTARQRRRGSERRQGRGDEGVGL